MHTDSETTIDEERRAMKVRWRKRSSRAAKSRLAKTIVISSCLTLLLCSTSLALVTHRLEGSFNGFEAPDGPFIPTISDAVDNSTGPSTGDIYVAGLSAVGKLNPDGTYAGTEITGAETPQGSFFLISEVTGRSQ